MDSGGGSHPGAFLEPTGWAYPKKIDRAQIQNLARLGFLENHSNVILMGGVGLRKIHLAIALGHAACRASCVPPRSKSGHKISLATKVAVGNRKLRLRGAPSQHSKTLARGLGRWVFHGELVDVSLCPVLPGTYLFLIKREKEFSFIGSGKIWTNKPTLNYEDDDLPKALDRFGGMGILDGRFGIRAGREILLSASRANPGRSTQNEAGKFSSGAHQRFRASCGSRFAQAREKPWTFYRDCQVTPRHPVLDRIRND